MKIFLASGNVNKLNELRDALEASNLVFDIVSADEIGGMPDVEESGQTFEENALLKANALRMQGPAEALYLADDSGLEVDFLDGKPGVISARYAGEPCDDEANNDKLLGEMEGAAERKCRFRCVLALVGNGIKVTFSGSCEGLLLMERRGAGGFGYDPLFLPEESKNTFAEISKEDKALISHRARALAKLVDYLSET